VLCLLQFEYYGSSCWSATFMGNSVKGSQHGDSMLRFASDGAVITWSLPTIHIRGEPAASTTPGRMWGWEADLPKQWQPGLCHVCNR
jgi:hypothetical protein